MHKRFEGVVEGSGGLRSRSPQAKKLRVGAPPLAAIVSVERAAGCWFGTGLAERSQFIAVISNTYDFGRSGIGVAIKATPPLQDFTVYRELAITGTANSPAGAMATGHSGA